MTQIKICGITQEREAAWLNDAMVDYAGFVFYEKSKRNVSINQAKQICKILNENIKKIAVTVTPDVLLIEQLQEAGLDIIQVHGEWNEEVQSHCRIPVWRAFNLPNIASIADLRDKMESRQDAADNAGQIQAALVDAGDYGSGKTFGWESDNIEQSYCMGEIRKLKQYLNSRNVLFTLAGGLCAENVADGIRFFAPDVVDVSSGVEEETEIFRGKSREKIGSFVRAVRDTDKVSILQ